MLLILFAAVLLAVPLLLLLVPGRGRSPPVFKPSKVPKASYSKDLPEVIIVGAGIAGNALAKAFSDQGRQVLLFERDLSEPDRIVGEFLQPGGVNALKTLGMAECVDNIDGQWEKGYVVYKHSSNEWVQLPFPNNPTTKSPYEGISFHHGRFVQSLRKSASAQPNVTTIEAAVVELIEESDRVVGVKFRPKNTSEIREVRAPLTVVCDGCFSKFRKALIQNTPETVSNFVGVVMKDVKMPYEQHGHVFLIEPSPTLMYRIGSNEVRVLVDVPGQTMPQNIREYLLTTTAPQLPDGIREAFVAGVTAGPIKSMPNQKLHPNPFIRPGAIPLGDVYNMRHPLTGGGMTVALTDAVRLTSVLAPVTDFQDIASVQSALDYFYDTRKPLASTINILAFALYSIFCGGSDDPAVVESVRQACFGYFKLGGQCVEGPMSLLSGLVESSNFLLYHYVRVALYGAYSVLFPPYPWKLWHAVKVLSAAYSIFSPLLTAERAGFLSNVWRKPEYRKFSSPPTPVS